MSIQKFTLLMLLFLGISFSACKKEEMPTTTTTANQEVADKLPGIWILTKVIQDSVDISNQVTGSLTFSSDKTMTSVGQESGFTIIFSGTWLVKDEGKTLQLDTDIAGQVNYIIHSFSETKMVLETNLGLSIRVFDFEKQ